MKPRHPIADLNPVAVQYYTSVIIECYSSRTMANFGVFICVLIISVVTVNGYFFRGMQLQHCHFFLSNICSDEPLQPTTVYTVSQKKGETLSMAVTLSILD